MKTARLRTNVAASPAITVSVTLKTGNAFATHASQVTNARWKTCAAVINVTTTVSVGQVLVSADVTCASQVNSVRLKTNVVV